MLDPGVAKLAAPVDAVAATPETAAAFAAAEPEIAASARFATRAAFQGLSWSDHEPLLVSPARSPDP
jgi:hypothetical protein